jgi:hypothetical protein
MKSRPSNPAVSPKELSKLKLRDTHGPNPNCFQLSRKATMGFTFVARRAGR